MTTTSNRLLPAIEKMQAKLAGLDAEQVTSLEGTVVNTVSDHFAYQQAQSHAFASGRISQAEATLIYAALGEIPAADGWASGTSLAAKIVVTQAVGELLGARVGCSA